jgi:hypothetical protein
MTECKHDWHFIEGTDRLRCARCGAETGPRTPDQLMQDLLADVTTMGSAWMKDGKRIDPRDVYAVPTKQMQEYKLHDSRPNSIIFHCAVNDEQTAVLRISKDGIWANPDVPVDDAAKAVLAAVDGYVKDMVARAVSEQAAEIERLGKLCYDYIGELTALRAAKQMQQRIDELKGQREELETVYETIVHWDEGGGKRSRRELARRIVGLFPGRPEWQGLTEEEVMNFYMFWVVDLQDIIGFYKAIERKLKERNHA